MDLEEIGINTRNWVDLALECSCESGVEPPGSISHGVGSYIIANITLVLQLFLTLQKLELLFLLLRILLISRSMDLWIIAFISSLCSCDKLSFPPFQSSAFSLAPSIVLFLKSSRSWVLNPLSDNLMHKNYVKEKEIERHLPGYYS